MTSIGQISCVIGTAGHIDHGKTLLVKALTGIDTDRLKEEKKRGVSIDLGFAWLDFERQGEKLRAALVDVPGHERFIRNMLAGTTGIDLVLFCVAADDGIMPQTREHLDIVRLLGVKRGVFAITKADLASEDRVTEVAGQIRTLISGTALEGSPMVAVSAVTGHGVDGLKAILAGLSALSTRKARAGGFFRLPVDRSFVVKGFGTVVTGTIASGSVRKGDELVLFPSGQKARVRGIQSQHAERESASAGQRAAINLGGTGHKEVGRGALVCSPELLPFVEAAQSRRPRFVDCAFDLLPAGQGVKPRPLKNRAVLKVYHLTGESLATILLGSGKEAAPGEKTTGRLALKGPLLMMRGDRFILRDPAINATVGGGEALVPYISRELTPPAGECAFLQDEKASDIIMKLLPQEAGACLFSELCLMLGAPEGELERQISGAGFERSEEFLIVKDRLVEAFNAAEALLRAFHGANPMEAGAGEELFVKGLRAVASALPAEKGQAFIRELLETLSKEGKIKKAGALWALPLFTPASSGVEAKVEAALMEILSKFQPDLEAVQKLPFKKQAVEKALSYLKQNGAVVKLREGSYISSAALEEARGKMENLIGKNGGIRASEFRDALGCGRKFAIEILEYFDKERVTIRNRDDVRTLR